MSKVHILDQAHEMPEMATERFCDLQTNIQKRQQLIRSGHRPRTRWLGIIQRPPSVLDFDERLGELELLIQDYDEVIVRLLDDQQRYRRFFERLTASVREGIARRCEEVREMEIERAQLMHAAETDGDKGLLNQLDLTHERLLRAVRVMGQATLLILKRISVCQDSLEHLTKDQNTQKKLLERLIGRLKNHQRLYHLQREVERFEQDVARMAQGALNFEEQLRECFEPLQNMLDQVSSVDQRLHNAVGEIEQITRLLTDDRSDFSRLEDGLDDQDTKMLEFLVSSHLKRDRIKEMLELISSDDGSLEEFEARLREEESPDEGALIGTALDNLQCVLDLRMGPMLSSSATVILPPQKKTHRARPDVKTTPVSDAGRLIGEHAGPLHSVAFSPNGRQLVVGGHDAQVQLWSVEERPERRAFKGHSDHVLSVAFSPDGQRIASCSRDRTIRIWCCATGDCEQVIRGHRDQILAVAFGAVSHLIATCSRDTTVRLWELTTGRCLYTLNEHNNWVNALAFSPDGQSFASGAGDATLFLWETHSGRRLQTFAPEGKGIEALAFSPDGRYLASGGWDRIVRLWDLRSGCCVETFEAHKSDVRALSFSPTHPALLCSGGADGRLLLWDINKREPLAELSDHSKGISEVGFSPDGKWIVSTSADATLRLRRVPALSISSEPRP